MCPSRKSQIIYQKKNHALELKSEFRKVEEYKVNKQKSIIFLYIATNIRSLK